MYWFSKFFWNTVCPKNLLLLYSTVQQVIGTYLTNVNTKVDQSLVIANVIILCSKCPPFSRSQAWSCVHHCDGRIGDGLGEVIPWFNNVLSQLVDISNVMTMWHIGSFDIVRFYCVWPRTANLQICRILIIIGFAILAARQKGSSHDGWESTVRVEQSLQWWILYSYFLWRKVYTKIISQTSYSLSGRSPYIRREHHLALTRTITTKESRSSPTHVRR